ncbi:MAG: class I SAM-dependent methyltransferase [Cyanobacteriota bacterium ELA615]
MTNKQILQDYQIEYWNGFGGERWVAEHKRTDLMLEPVASLLMAHVNLTKGMTVLDIGCGCGTTTIALREQVGTDGKIIGLDVSLPILTSAKERLASYTNVELICADAATYTFVVPLADLIFSRFGVMFFGDPIAAFTNLRTALKPSGRLLFACWRSFEENLWAKIPFDAVAPHIPPIIPTNPEDPGPFSFADSERVTRILTEAGFVSPRLNPFDFAMNCSLDGSLDDAVEQAMLIGPASRALREQSDSVIVAAKNSLGEALAPYQTNEGVILPGAVWLVESSC